MSQANSPEAQPSHLQSPPDKVILITSGMQDAKLAEALRDEVRHSGLECEIVLGDVSDPNHIRKLICDVLDCFHYIGVPVNDTVARRHLFIGKMTDEEWLAQ